jgi:HD-GYP domain-containing protein (c-di-GMP phosphodiesterase class II)
LTDDPPSDAFVSTKKTPWQGMRQLESKSTGHILDVAAGTRSGGLAHAGVERRQCEQCGAHVFCTVGLATTSGFCTVCGSGTLRPLHDRTTRSARRFAAPSPPELEVMSDSGYGGIVLDRLASQAADILAVEQTCIFARDERDAAMTIVAAARGDAEDAIGKRFQISAERAAGATAPAAALELCWEGEVQGALSVRSDTAARLFSPQELQALEALGAAAAAALAHTRAHSSSGDVRSSIHTLEASLAAFDAYTAEHSRDVVDLALDVGRAIGFTRAGLAELRVAALLHDIGKIRVPDTILNKPGPLTPTEREVIAQHPGFGADVLMRVPRLEPVATLVRYHHERWDGAGYPDGLSANRIPLASRIIAVCDAYSAIISDRSYRPARSHERALAELRDAAGWQFDASVVSHLHGVLERKDAR